MKRFFGDMNPTLRGFILIALIFTGILSAIMLPFINLTYHLLDFLI